MWLCSLTCSLGFGVLEPLGFLQVQREYGTAMPLAHKAIAVCRDLLWPGPGLAGRPEALPAPCRLQAACHQPHPPPSPPLPTKSTGRAPQAPHLRQRCMPGADISQPGPLDPQPIQQAQASGNKPYSSFLDPGPQKTQYHIQSELS